MKFLIKLYFEWFEIYNHINKFMNRNLKLKLVVLIVFDFLEIFAIIFKIKFAQFSLLFWKDYIKNIWSNEF